MEFDLQSKMCRNDEASFQRDSNCYSAALSNSKQLKIRWKKRGEKDAATL